MVIDGQATNIGEGRTGRHCVKDERINHRVGPGNETVSQRSALPVHTLRTF